MFLETAINALGVCSHITELSIQSPHRFDLNSIASNFPLLESFSNPGTRDTRSSRRATRIEPLRLLYDRFVPTDGPWLPLRSAETLTELSLRTGRDPVPGFVDTDAMAAFLNLKSLTLCSLTETLCEFTIGAPIQLEVFSINLIPRHVRIDRFVEMLRADCLCNLEILDIENWHDDTSDLYATERYWTAVFDAFTRTLSSVMEVQLSTPLHLEWCPYFGRMPDLKRLHWHGRMNPHFCGETSDPQGRIVGALEATFANFVEKPQVVVRYNLR